MSEAVDPGKLPELLATLSFEERKEDPGLHGNPVAQQAFLDASKILSALKAGDVDPWLGLRIETIVRKSTRYIIYLDPDLDVQWFWLTRPDDVAVGMVQARISQLTKESAFLLVGRVRRKWTLFGAKQAPAITSEDLFLAKEIRCVMGEALALALTGASEADCEAVLDEAKRYIAVAKDLRTRPWFVTVFLFTVGLLGAVLAGWICWLAKCCVNNIDHPFVTGWLEAAVAGSAGALISALLRTRDLGLEPAAHFKGIAVEAVARALIGAGSGVLMSFAFDSGVLLKGALANQDTSHFLRLFLCVASGVSERMLPALVGRAESLAGGASGDSDTKGGGGSPRPDSKSGGTKDQGGAGQSKQTGSSGDADKGGQGEAAGSHG
jgi:hypothetical protein